MKKRTGTKTNHNKEKKSVFFTNILKLIDTSDQSTIHLPTRQFQQ